MSTITVTTLNDAGAGSLREALADASAGDTIDFASNLAGGTLRLTSGTLDVTTAVTIDGDVNGDGAPDITITGDAAHDDITDASGITNLADPHASLFLSDNVQILNATAELTLDGLVLTGGVAASEGGAIYGGTVTLIDTTVSGNEAGTYGGGIAAGTATLTDSTVSGNVAASAGGIDAGVVNLTGSTVSGNYVGGDVGGIVARAVTLTDTTVSGNRAHGNDGGIDALNATLTNSTVSGNSALNGNGGGLTVATTAHLTNSIVLGNSAAGAGADIYGDGIATLTYAGGNIVGAGAVASFYSTSGTAAHAVASADLGTVFAALDGTTGGGLLADNGGAVETIALADTATNPAIDAGDQTLSGVPTTDARGFLHVDDASVANQGSDIVDLGAFEVSHTIEVTTLSDVVDPNDGVTSLREALLLANSDTGHADTITFDPSLAGGTLRLTSTLDVTNAVTIDGHTNGEGVPDITISGDVNGDDSHVGATGITDIAASTTAGTLGDNVQIFDSTADLTLNGLVLTGGIAHGSSGGAIYAAGHAVTASDSIVSGNDAQSDGGGIYATTTALTGSTVSGNSAGHFGGGVFALGTATLTDSTVNGNGAAVADGGGIFASDAVLTNSTISGNSAGADGGGIFAGSTATLTDSTVSGNYAADNGGGIFAGTGATLTNSVVLGNQSANGDAEIHGAVTTQGSNIVGGVAASDVFAATADNHGVDAGVLADNGGPVETIALADTATNPAIDAGDQTLAGVPATDARGFAHVDDPNVANHGSDIADLGAFEDVHTIEVTTLSDTVDPNDGVTSLREALAIANADTGHADTITFDPGLAGGTLHLASTLDVTNAVTIDGDTNGDGKADITITGDTLGNDVATNGITDIAASQAKAVGLGTALTDNVQIFHATGDLTLNSLVLTGGSSSGLGGAIYAATGTTLTVTDSMVSGNYAGLDAGGLFAQSNASLTNTTVSGNVSAGYSGGLGGGVVTLINSTISGNTANRGGGGLSINSGTLINSTVSGNDGGGLLVSDAVTVTNSILLGNSSAGGSDVTFFVILPGPGTLTFTGNNILGSAPTNFTNVTGTYSLLDSTSATDLGSVFASVGNDPSTGILSGQLADNGGPVETIALAATATNPALDAGDDALAPSTDARGDARVDIPNAGDDGTNFSDLGAFEVQSIPDRAPSGIDGTVTTLEDTPHVLAASDFAFNDLDNNALKAVEVTTLPTAGTLTDNGHAVHSGDFVSAADIAAGELVFTPTANANGIDAASFTFQVQDSGGTAGGVDLDPTPNTLTIDVTPVNDAPSGTDGVVVTAEDSTYTFAAADFSFSDIDGNALKAVEITTLPAAGTLTDNGAAVAAGQFVSAADIAGGKLVFTPTANGNGTDYTHFTFQVQDDGGLANGGVDTDPTPRTLTIDVNPVNDAPVATVPGTAYHATAKVALPLAGTGLAVSDVDGGSAVETVTLAVGEGTLEATAGNSGVAMVGDGTAALTLFGTIAELDALLDGSSTGTLSYLDPTDTPVAATTLTLAVDDNGATGSGGALSDSQSVMIDIAPAPETAPVVADDAAAVSEFATVAGDVITGSAGGAGADHDADGDPLTVTAVAGAEGAGTVGHALLGAYGTLTLDADGSFSYRADHASPLPAGASETDSFTYTVSDGRGGTGTATLAVTITGTATGDDAANHLVGGAGNDTLDGNGGDDFISGGGGGDVINGGDGSDVLRGNLGGDILLGRNGDDHLAGGAGNDTLVGGRGDDILVGGMGNDSLAGNAGNDLLNGRAGDDTLVGGVGRDVLDGEGGADLLTGGAGRDTFLFDTRPIRGNVDTVTDFTPGFDHIALSRAVFAALGPAHHLAAAAFSDDGTAHTRAEHVIYNPTTGDLSYDANGSMAGGMHHFATLEAHLHVTSADFLVVA